RNTRCGEWAVIPNVTSARPSASCSGWPTEPICNQPSRPRPRRERVTVLARGANAPLGQSVSRWVAVRSSAMSGAAFFDLDNTLIKGSVLFHAGAGMVRHGLVTRREIARHARRHAAFRWRGEHTGELAGVRERALMI